MRRWRRRVLIAALVIAVSVVTFLWLFPVYAVDRKSRTGMIHGHASKFAWALSALTDLNGGKVVALDNHSSDYLAQIALLEGKVPGHILENFRDLKLEKAHFYTAPSAIGKQVNKLGEWEMLTVVDSEEFRRFKGFTRDEIPILEPQSGTE